MDQQPFFYFCLVGGLITLALILAILPVLRDQAEAKPEHDWIWSILILAILAAGRWPSIFFPRELNPDEGLMIGGARALLFDPIYWRSVDGGTAGPLDFFALWPAGAFFGWETYLTARLTALGLLAVTLILAHQCVSLLWGKKVARVAGLAAVCLEALTNTVDLLHYSTELVPMTFLAGAVYAAIRRWAYDGRPVWNMLGGLLLGAVPFAKLQVAPLAACVGLGWLLAELFSKEPDRARRSACLFAGALFPAALFASQLTITGEWGNFFIPYIFSNIDYSKDGVPSLRRLIGYMLDFSVQQDSLLHLWLPGSLIWVLLMVRLRRFASRSTRIFTLVSCAAFPLALMSVVYPGKTALHYWHIAIVPCTFLLGSMTGNLLATAPPLRRKGEHWLVAVCAFSLVGTLLIHRAWAPNGFMGFRSVFHKEPHNRLVSRILTHAHPGDSLAIWGWSNYIYVETGLRQATRDGAFSRSIEIGPYRDFYRKRFLADLDKRKPTFFVDTVGPGNTIYQVPELAHDRNFPELAATIRADYLLIDEVMGARLYRRHDPPIR